MALTHSPSVVTNGLVFYYDMANPQKSWQGRPTTNLVSNPNAAINVITDDIPQEVRGKNVTGYASYSTDYAVLTLGTTSTSATGKTFTYSLWMRSPGAQSTYLMYVFDGTGPDGGWWNFGSGSLTTQWQRYTGTASGLTGTVQFIRIYRLNQVGTIQIAAPQFEESTFATPFINGARSNTQSVLDLTTNYTLTGTNIIYNSNGTFSFNDSYFDLNSANIITGNNPFTVESWYTTTGTSADEIFGNYGAAATSGTLWVSGRYGTYINGSVYFPGAPLGAGTYHLMTTRNAAGNVILYLNGNQVNAGVLSASIPVGFNFRIGADVNGGAEPFTGNIHSVKVYNRVLSAAEVRQNFNSQRGRYGI